MDEILNGRTVLVVDDTNVNRMVAADILKAAGVTVLEADSGEGALKAARENGVDAFLLDVRMGDMNGIELCRSLRAMECYRNTPIIFVTAVDEREVLQWALEAGADDYIQKPLHAMVLRRRLANLLQKSEAIRRAEQLSRSLQRYVSPRAKRIAREVAASGVLPPPVRDDLCVLFADSRGFTEMSQDLAPETVFEILSGLLAALAEVVYWHGGDIDKYAGDGVMAVFEGRDGTQRGCRCALDLIDKARGHRVPGAAGPIRLGVGLHTGSAMVGNLGTAEHLDYTVVGSSVNLAARLCGLGNQSVVVSQAVRDALADEPAFAFANRRNADIRGFRDPVTVYDLQRR
jgi:class 3 adenylate cyclase